ncbi:MAG TPA: hypothetical protein VEV45_20785 [Streptosporangiaceae bacterium]|nr:hypothetical protein [Streptosporangiaceae bacterium]
MPATEDQHGDDAVETYHSEEFRIVIRPTISASWPDTPAEGVHGRKKLVIRPDRIQWAAYRGSPLYPALLNGYAYKADGSVGVQRSRAREFPQWALDKLNAVREQRGWTDEFLREHGVMMDQEPIGRPL